MSKTRKSGPFALNRRAFFGAAAAGLGAAGAPGLAGAAPVRATAVEPDLTDATANAPGYSGQPRRRPSSAADVDPLDLALKS
jgi:hypothetical protein